MKQKITKFSEKKRNRIQSHQIVSYRTKPNRIKLNLISAKL